MAEGQESASEDVTESESSCKLLSETEVCSTYTTSSANSDLSRLRTPKLCILCQLKKNIWRIIGWKFQNNDMSY